MLGLFIAKHKNLCSQIYVELNNDKIFAAIDLKLPHSSSECEPWHDTHSMFLSVCDQLAN